jgi:hypothetical protein
MEVRKIGVTPKPSNNTVTEMNSRPPTVNPRPKNKFNREPSPENKQREIDMKKIYVTSKPKSKRGFTLQNANADLKPWDVSPPLE